jgi:hypothetical protein
MAESCDHPGCPRTDATPCSYTDRRGRPCGYSWCPDHSAPFNRLNYCRRHGGVIRAIAENPYDTIEPPDLDNRALSLCEWVSADLDADVQAMLGQLQQPTDGSFITLHPLRLVIQRMPHRRGWARVWTLSTNAGVVKKLGVEVDEDRDAEVRATVDGNTVASQVPPWIGDRGVPISDDAAKRKRDQFREDLLSAMGNAARTEPTWS